MRYNVWQGMVWHGMVRYGTWVCTLCTLCTLPGDDGLTCWAQVEHKVFRHVVQLREHQWVAFVFLRCVGTSVRYCFVDILCDNQWHMQYTTVSVVAEKQHSPTVANNARTHTRIYQDTRTCTDTCSNTGSKFFVWLSMRTMHQAILFESCIRASVRLFTDVTSTWFNHMHRLAQRSLPSVWTCWQIQ